MTPIYSKCFNAEFEQACRFSEAIRAGSTGCSVDEDPTAPDDERRRYYRLTGFGGEVLAAEVKRLDSLVRAARRKGAFPAQKPSPEGA